jgi:hypothetical protein
MSKPQARTASGRFAGRAHLSDEQVVLIQKLAANTDRSHGDIARQFGVSRPLVSRIVNGTRRAARKELEAPDGGALAA